MKIERDERRFDFHDIGLAIKRAREASGMTQEQLAYIVDRAPRTIMYNENDGQHPSFCTSGQCVPKSGMVGVTSFPHTAQPGGVCLAKSSTRGRSPIREMILTRASSGFLLWASIGEMMN